MYGSSTMLRLNFPISIRLPKKRTVFIFVFIILVVSLIELNSILSCNHAKSHEHVKTKDGRYIPKVSSNAFAKTPSFRELSTRNCTYPDYKGIDCLDIHLRGNSLIRQIQLRLTRVVIVFDLICRKHKIKYWLHSGTLLGAVRNNMFIPWDNDVDVGMLREDYNKFVTISKAVLPSDIFLQNVENDPYYYIVQRNTAKLRDRNSCNCLCLRYGCEHHDGLMMDIFVYDKSPKKHKIYESHFRKDWYEHDELFPLKEITFEGYRFYVPHESKKILTRLYGNISSVVSRRKQCPSKGYIGHPWYSCDEINAMKKVEKKRAIQESRISNDWILYYVY